MSLLFTVNDRPPEKPIRGNEGSAMLERFAPHTAGGEFVGIGIDRAAFELDRFRPIRILLANSDCVLFLEISRLGPSDFKSWGSLL